VEIDEDAREEYSARVGGEEGISKKKRKGTEVGTAAKQANGV
jgi:hypothetical protein